ncbi:adenylate kinase 9 isoform X2 [Parambassis ranga]|uniref:Adenylate kinase 9 isoform X2 n=1 Tax=Parambassis ranga TaxID=210632 RepID=A0A6P7HV51_9TELE|nr:adenylate kinase 9 isoform X2 [Parambassis ranga]
MNRFVDNLIEDEAERENLLAKPVCFIIVGKPGVGKSTLAKIIAESWKCILIDDTDLLESHIKNKTKDGEKLLDILYEGRSIPADMLLQLILDRLNSLDVEHYGYVLSSLPFMSEEGLMINEQIELIKNLKLKPDFIINIKCADKDLVQRLSDLKQHPETGQLYNRDQLKCENVYSQKENKDQDVDDEEQLAEEEELPRYIIDQMVWPSDNLVKNALIRINMYKNTMLRPLEDYMAEHNPFYLLELDGNSTPEELHLSVMSRLGSMAIKRVSIPVPLTQSINEEFPEHIDTEDLLINMRSCSTVAPGFRWRRSRWGRTCPVALKEGKIIPGRPEFSVGFQDKFYILSSEEAYQKFTKNPRQYLLPPMPRLPCRASIIGPPQAGKSPICKLLAQHYNASVLDIEELVQPVLAKFEQERLDKIKEETTQAAIENIKMKMNQDDTQSSVTDDHPEVQAMVHSAVEKAKQLRPSPTSLYAEVLKKHIQEIEEVKSNTEIRTGWVLGNFSNDLSLMEALQQAKIMPDMVFCLKDSDGHQADKWELGNPTKPEMDEYEQQLQKFVGEWKKRQSASTVALCILEIGGRSPENLLQEMVQQMERPFQYVARKLSTVDLEEEAEDFTALADLERAEEGSSESYIAEAEEEESTAKRLLGDTHHFCPVTLKNHNALWACKEEIAARYREKTFFFSSEEARDTFLQNPAEFVAQTEPLKPPAMRIILLGARGSGKTTNGEWLAQQLGIFHIQFRDLLQMRIIAKTKQRVPYADEVVSLKDNSEDLDAQIKEARGEDQKRMEENSTGTYITEQEVALTDEEMNIKEYLCGEKPLYPEILDMVVTPFWKQEPYKSTGFILEGFPHNPSEVQHLLQQKLFPDVVVVLKANVADVQKRLLPTYLRKWSELQNKRRAQLNLLRDLKRKNREENISKRRAELMAGHALKAKSHHSEEETDEEDEAVDNTEDKIQAKLEEEFPLEEDTLDIENGETEDAATERLEIEIEERFVTDNNHLVTVTELLSELNIPKLSIDVSRMVQIIRHQLMQKIQLLLCNRESLFQQCHPISCSLANKLLLSCYKLHSAFGCRDPIMQYKEKDLIQPLQWPLNSAYPLIFNQFIYFFASKENRNTFMLNPLKYLQQPKPFMPLPVKFAVTGPPKSGKTTVAQLLAKKYGLVRLSINGILRMVLDTQGHTDLAIQIKNSLSLGHMVPDELAIQCLEVAVMSSACSTRGYVLDGFPITLKQAKLMDSLSIIPMIVVELELDVVEVLRRGQVDKMNPDKPHLMHDSSEILHTGYYCYKKEVEHVRRHYQQQYQNWYILDGLKSKWWMWSNILKTISVSMKNIHTYLERTQNGQAACINRLCITPEELKDRLGEFGHYCPVCLALHHHLVDCSETVALTHAAEYKGPYYKMCGENHLEKFLSNPDQYVAPGCPHILPQPHLLPRKLTEIQVKNRFPQQVQMQGFCPVSYLDGKQRYEALVQGKMEYAVEYRERIYICETMQKQDKFMRTPETYWDQKLPSKIPPLCEPVPLTSLPTMGYLEQGVAVSVIKAMTAVGCLKPKYPFRSIQRSAVLYVAYYMKAFNPKSTEYTCQKYKKNLALFEENCALIPFLSTAMRGNYMPPSDRPIDLVFKLNRFLALRDVPAAAGKL